MPQQDQDLNYKVKLDTADLAAQLQQVRAQIDQAVGSVAFNSTAMTSQPSQFAFPIQDYARQAGLLAQTDMQNVVSAAQMGGRHIATMTEAAQLGFQKFNNDVQNALLTQGPALLNAAGGGFYPDIASRSFTSNAAAALIGWGYKSTMAMTPGEHSRLSAYRLEQSGIRYGLETAGGFVGQAVGAAIGTYYGGAAGGMVGRVVGGWVGEKTGQLADDTLGITILRDFYQGQRIKEETWNTSWRFLGGRFSRAEAGRIGTDLAGAQRSDALLGYNVKSGDIDRVISEFTEIGGFDSVRNAQDYEQKSRAVIENHRKIMELMRTTEKEALSIIKEMYTLNANADIPATTLRLNSAAYAVGLTGREALEFGKQSAEMVRGTGITMESGFWGGLNTLELVRGAQNKGLISQELINQFGGAENYALNLNRVGYTWAQSTSGLTQFAAASATGGFENTIGMTPTQTMGAAVGYLTKGGIQGMLEYSGTMQERISNQNPAVLNAMSGMQIAEQMYAAGIKVNKDSFIGLMQLQGISTTQAAQTWNTMVSGDTVDKSSIYLNSMQTANDITRSALSKVIDKTENAVSSFFQFPVIGKFFSGKATTIGDIFDTETASERRIGLYKFDVGGINFDKIDKAALEQVTKVVDKMNITTQGLTAWNDYNREHGEAMPLSLAIAVGRQQDKLSKTDKPRTDEEILADYKTNNTKTVVLADKFERPIINSNLKEANAAYNNWKNLRLIAPAPVRWLGDMGMAITYGTQALLGESQLESDQERYDNTNKAISTEQAKFDDLEIMGKKLKGMGANMARSAVLQHDPMLVINQMGAESANRGASAQVELLLMARTHGINVNVQSHSGYDYSKEEKK